MFHEVAFYDLHVNAFIFAANEWKQSKFALLNAYVLHVCCQFGEKDISSPKDRRFFPVSSLVKKYAHGFSISC